MTGNTLAAPRRFARGTPWKTQCAAGLRSDSGSTDEFEAALERIELSAELECLRQSECRSSELS